MLDKVLSDLRPQLFQLNINYERNPESFFHNSVSSSSQRQEQTSKTHIEKRYCFMNKAIRFRYPTFQIVLVSYLSTDDEMFIMSITK